MLYGKEAHLGSGEGFFLSSFHSEELHTPKRNGSCLKLCNYAFFMYLLLFPVKIFLTAQEKKKIGILTLVKQNFYFVQKL